MALNTSDELSVLGGHGLSPAGVLHDLKRSLAQQRFICTYFDQLNVEYETLCPAQYHEQTSAVARQLRAQHATQPSWALNHRFEHLVMAGVAPEVLEQRIVIYRERLKTLLGAAGAASVDALFDPSAALESRRTMALGLLAEIQRLRDVRSEFERLRNRLLWCLLAAGGFFGMVCFTLLQQSWQWLPPMVHVLSAGLLGGYFSVLLKLGALRFCLEYNSNYQQVDRLFWNISYNLLLSMFEGAVGALILYTIFLAGLLKGSLFPEFPAQPVGTISELFWMSPVLHEEAAKLIVWCVIAGFSERLIPDFLSTLTQQVKQPRAAADGDAPGAKPAEPAQPPTER